MKVSLKVAIPLAALAILLILPAPVGLPVHAWRFLAIFIAVILGIILEPLPGGAIGLIGVVAATAFARFVLFGPDEIAQAGFKVAPNAIRWALSGFSNTTVWLIFAAFMFSLGYEKTGLGRRIALLLVRAMGGTTLTLGYAAMLADTILAPFTPSNTARSGGTIYPVLAHLPPLYGSKPNDPSASKIGSYLMWVAIASTCVTSSLFLTGFAPNLLALEIVRKSAKVEISWLQWFYSAAPIGLTLLLITPLLAYWTCKPEVARSEEAPKWAASELKTMGPMSRSEIVLMVLVAMALGLWIFGDQLLDPTATALLVIAMMLITSVVTWDDLMHNHTAWNTLVWFATLVAMADGLARVGVISWFAALVGQYAHGMTPTMAVFLLVAVFYFSHFLFASVTAHTTAMLPVVFALGVAIPGVPLPQLAILLSMSLGIMGIITPYATGPSPVYYGSGYLPPPLYWRLGTIFGLVFFAALMLIAVPWVLSFGPSFLTPIAP